MRAAPPIQTIPTLTTHRSSRRRPLALALAAPVLATAVLPAAAGAQDYAYTGECSLYVSSASDGKKLYRQYRARFLRNRDGANWSMPGYDYTYTIDRGLPWGPHSDERVDFERGRTKGPASWHSPDNHTSNVSWVAERGWKASGDRNSTEMSVHAWFDVPSSNDPECTVATATF